MSANRRAFRIERFDDAFKLLAKLFTRTATAPAEWLQEGSLRPFLVLLIAAVAIPLTGPARYLGEMHILPSLVIASYLLLVATVPLWPALFARRPGGKLHFVLGLAAIGLVAGFACFVLYNHYYAGLVNYRGTDGSFHAFYYHEFVRGETHTYQGFNSMYATLWAAQKVFHCDVFWAFVIVFYTELALVSALPLVITFTLLRPLRHSHRVAYAVGVVLAPPILAAILYYCVLPEQHMYQADGFFPQLFGLLPLFALWLIDALVLWTPLRIFYLLAAMVLLRFTYALNIGDAALALVVLFAIELGDRRLRPWFRIAIGVTIVALVLMARVVYKAFWPLLPSKGHFLFYPVEALDGGIVVGLVFLLLVVVSTLGSTPLPERGFARAARFPLLFGLATIVLMIAMQHSSLPKRYYYYKYPLFALVLVASACGAILPALIARAVAAIGVPRLRLQLAILVLASGYFVRDAATRWYGALQTHWPYFMERAWAKPPYLSEMNLPLADVGAFRRIEKTLATEHKRFAGYLMSQFGMMMFTNAAFDVPGFGWGIWFDYGLKTEQPDSCFFWDEGTSREWLVWENGYFVLTEERRHLMADPHKVCQWYHAHWDPDGPPRILCHLCWDGKGHVVAPR